MIVAQKPAQSLVAPYEVLAVAALIPRKQQDVALPLVIPLAMEMVDIVAERSTRRITLDKHSSLIDLTQRSA